MARGPWPAGTLLGYRVISNLSDYVRNSDLWNKYVLLRVVKVGAFFGGTRKSMAVCLYDWVGDSLPSPDIVKSLSFTYISMDKPMLGDSYVKCLTEDLKDGHILHTKLDEIITNVSIPSVCTFVLLDWRCNKRIDSSAVFTPLGCDPEFKDHTPEIYDRHTGGIDLTHSIPFDATLVRRFSIKER